MKQKILITSALLYANGPIHFGHMAGAYLPADIYARFSRLMGHDVAFISGSDEYGMAITLSAQLAKRTPKEHVEEYHHINQRLFERLDMSFDHYSRTTWPEHIPLSQDFFKVLLRKGLVEDKETDQLYSPEDQRFLADRYVVGTCPLCKFDEARGDECPKCGGSFEALDLINPKSKLSHAPLIKKKTTHWFLRLDLFKEQLLEWIRAKNWKSNVVNFITQYINDLRPRAITRDMEWGVPLPIEGVEGKVLYVWFDAPIGYISATKEWSLIQGQPDLWKSYWLDPATKLVQFIGKDNIPFHSVVFPAMIMGQDVPYKLVDELPANEFLNLEGRQLSKSDGWYIDMAEFLDNYDCDQLRYTLAANAPENSDSEFTWTDFYHRCNGELLGKLGNFVNRVLVFMKTHLGSKIPHYQFSLDQQVFLKEIHSLVLDAQNCYAQFQVRKSSQILMEIAQKGNAFFDHAKPWKMVQEDPESLPSVMMVCLEMIKILSLVAYPIIPRSSMKIMEMLGWEGSLFHKMSYDEIIQKSFVPGDLLPAPAVLFKKLEKEQIDLEIAKLKKQYEEVQKKKNKPLTSACKVSQPSEITFDEFKKMELRLAKVIEAQEVPKSKKLLKLKVDLGDHQRQIVSGIREHYTPEELIGQQVVIVANLKPTKIMGIESQGMILAASQDGLLEVITASKVPPGSLVS